MEVLFLLLLAAGSLCNVININNSEELFASLCNTSLADSSHLHFNKASYTLVASTGFCIIQNVHNITLRSTTGHSSINCSSEERNGFGFVNVTNVTITGIHFHGCGSSLTEKALAFINNSHPFIGYLQKAVLLFNHCHNIKISLVNIDHYNGYAIMMMNPIGHSSLNDVLVTAGIGSNKKSCLSDDTFSCAGSGIMCAFKDTSLVPVSSNVTVELVHLTISLGFNVILNIPPLEEAGANLCQLPLIGAAGLSLIFNQSYMASFVCNTCISYFCGGTVAGNMLILYTNGMYNSQVTIVNSLFTNGFLISGGLSNQVGGSGITVLSISCGACNNSNSGSWIPLKVTETHIKSAALGFRASESDKFINPYFGGGIYLHILNACGPKFILIYLKVFFRWNYAYNSGSNLYAFISRNARKKSHVSLLLKDNRAFHFSQKIYPNLHYSSVAGITLINWNNVTIDGGFFKQCNSSQIAAYNSKVFITGHISFDNNTSDKGAALYLQSSYLILQEPLKATFLRNKALLYGGAVYIDNRIIPKQKQACGMQIKTEKKELSNLRISLNFNKNEAGLAGKSLYVNQLYNCLKFYDQMMINFSWSGIMNFNSEKSKSNSIKEVSAMPVLICSCASVIPCQVKSLFYYTYPGKVVSFSLCAVDESGSIVYSSAVASVLSTGQNKQKNVYLKQEQKQSPLSGTGATVVHYVIYSKINEIVNAILSIATPQNPQSWSATIAILPCPLGFMLHDDECICDSFITRIIPHAECNITSVSISISTGQWLGNVSNVLGFSFFCHPQNCKTDVTFVNVTDPLSLCQDSKEGVLCAQCRVGLSVVFGASQCLQCSDLWLLSLLGYALSGVLLVAVMLYLPLTISRGPLAGIIIAMNLTAASTIDTIEGQSWFLLITRVCVSVINLSLGFPLCLYNGMTPVVKTGLLFVYPVYLWVLMIVFIIFSHYSTRVSNKTAMHSVQVLASLMYLSFSKILMTLIDIIAYIPVHTHNSTLTMWYIDGSVPYFSTEDGHFILYILALLFLLFFIVPFILFVTFGRHCLRLECINKYLRQFLEAFQGPYKHSKGYWFGVRVIVLTYVYMMWGVLRGYNHKLMLFLQLIPVNVLCYCQLYLKPYRSSLLNKIDSICLVIPILQMILVAFFSSSIIPFIIASLNDLILIGLLTFIVCQVIKKTKYFKCFKSTRMTSRSSSQGYEDYDEMRRFLLDVDK